MKYAVDGILKTFNNHNAVSLLPGLFFLIMAICFFPFLMLFFLFYFYPGPEPKIPVFAVNKALASLQAAATRRERSPPQ